MISLLTEDYSLDDLANLPLEEFSSLLQKKGKGRFKSPEELAKTIKKAIRGSYRLGSLAQESIDAVLSVIASQIRGLEKSIKELDNAIEQLVVVIPEYQCLTSIPGIGKVYAAGLSWKIQQSGNFTSKHTPLTKQGNRYFRYYLVEAANSVRRHLPEYAEFYQKKYKETPKNQHKRAIVLTAIKFVCLVDTLLRNHQLYTPPRSVIEN